MMPMAMPDIDTISQNTPNWNNSSPSRPFGPGWGGVQIELADCIYTEEADACGLPLTFSHASIKSELTPLIRCTNL